MGKTIVIFFFVVSALMQGCRNDLSLNFPDVEEQIVVDGWIEQNQYPVIILTRNSPYFSEIDSASLRDLIEMYAKVTISDGQNSEILSLKRDDNLFPPFYYSGNQIKGVVGRTYSILIEVNGKKITASTTVPAPILLDSIGFYQDTDTSGFIKARFTDNSLEKNYYRTFTKVQGQDKTYVPTLVSIYDDKYFNGKSFSFELKRGQETYLNPDINIHYALGDTISVRICTMDKKSFDFWDGYQREVISAGNPFASTYNTIESNVQGGLGIWCGYGATYYRVIAR